MNDGVLQAVSDAHHTSDNEPESVGLKPYNPNNINRLGSLAWTFILLLLSGQSQGMIQVG